MVAKLLVLFVVAAAVSQGQALTEITLADQHITFITNPLIGKTLTIPKLFLDTLESCHVIFPNGVTYEAFPSNNLPQGNGITFLESVQPYTSCGIGFLGATTSMSGTYELLSVVYHNLDSYRSLTRQRFHMTFVNSQS